MLQICIPMDRLGIVRAHAVCYESSGPYRPIEHLWVIDIFYNSKYIVTIPTGHGLSRSADLKWPQVHQTEQTRSCIYRAPEE